MRGTVGPTAPAGGPLSSGTVLIPTPRTGGLASCARPSVPDRHHRAARLPGRRRCTHGTLSSRHRTAGAAIAREVMDAALETLVPVLAGAELTGVRMVTGMVDGPAEAVFRLRAGRPRQHAGQAAGEHGLN